MKSNLNVLPAAILRLFGSPSAVVARSLPRPAKDVLMPRGDLIRMEKSSFVKTITVKNGVIWLTGASLGGDVLLSSGGQFELSDHWPYVIQALESAELSWR